MTKIVGLDLFAGLGGTSTGLIEAWNKNCEGCIYCTQELGKIVRTCQKQQALDELKEHYAQQPEYKTKAGIIAAYEKSKLNAEVCQEKRSTPENLTDKELDEQRYNGKTRFKQYVSDAIFRTRSWPMSKVREIYRQEPNTLTKSPANCAPLTSFTEGV